jgi:hypothetical protein
MFRYADHGPATLRQIVEDVSATSLNRYLRGHVFEPLGMADTTLARSEVVQSRLATGCKLRSTGPKPVTDREVVTAGAGGIYSSPKDMARYLAALLGGGANEHGSVLKPATLASMFAAQYQPHPRIPGMGLAFWRRTAGGHPVVEHQGIIPGFDSHILAAPDDGVGLMAFTNGASRAVQWMPVEMSRLLHHLLGVPEDVIRTDVPQQPEIWGDICGWYYLPGPLTDVRLRTIAGAGVEVFVRRGQLVLRFLTPIPALYRRFPLHPADDTDPYVFRMDLSEFGLGPFTVVFSSKPETETMAVHFDVMPLSAQQQAQRTNPRLWVEAALALSTIAILGRVFRRTRHHRRPSWAHRFES